MHKLPAFGWSSINEVRTHKWIERQPEAASLQVLSLQAKDSGDMVISPEYLWLFSHPRGVKRL